MVSLKALRRRAVPGRCLCCPRRARARGVLCGSDSCTRLYLRAWHADNRRAHPERYGGAFYRARGTRRPTLPPRRREGPALSSKYTPTTCLLPGMPYSELCRLFAQRYG